MSDPFQQIHQAILETQNKLDSRRLFYLLVFIGGSLAITLIVFMVFFQLSPNPKDIYSPTILLSLLSSLGFCHLINCWYRTQTKALFIQIITKASNLKFDAKGVLLLKDIDPHHALPLYETYKSKNTFIGNYNGSDITFEDIHLEGLKHFPKASNSLQKLTRFKGIVMRIRLLSPLQAQTVVLPRNVLQSFHWNGQKDFQILSIADTKLKNKYVVIGTDPVEARLLMNSPLIKALLDGRNKFKYGWLQMSIYKNELIILAATKRPLFDVGHLWSLLNEHYLTTSLRDLYAILEVVNAIKSNPRLKI